MAPVTIKEIAEAAGVSIATVSRVLNDSDHPVRTETRDQVVAIAKELGYHPNLAARNLRLDRSSMIGIVTDSVLTPHTPHVIRGIREAFREQSYYCVVINAYWDPSVERKEIQELLSHSVAGVVFVETWLDTANEMLDLVNKPYVYAHRLFRHSDSHAVVADDFYGASLAVEHLLDLGHRRIGYINGPEDYYASEERLSGYRHTLEQANIDVPPTNTATGDWSVESGYTAMTQLLQTAPELTGVFAANDRMAIGAIYAIEDAGMSVPGDMSVVGHDNEEMAEIIRPSLTTVTLPRYEIGRASAELLLRFIDGPAEPLAELKIGGRLIERSSTARATAT